MIVLRIETANRISPKRLQSFPLEARGEPPSGIEPTYSGEGHIAYRTGPLPNREPCTALVRGEGTFHPRLSAFIDVEDTTAPVLDRMKVSVFTLKDADRSEAA